jgi:hypothetical protein
MMTFSALSEWVRRLAGLPNVRNFRFAGSADALLPLQRLFLHRARKSGMTDRHFAPLINRGARLLMG